MTVIAYSSKTNSMACDSGLVDGRMVGPIYNAKHKIRWTSRKKGKDKFLIVAGFAGYYGFLNMSWDHIQKQLTSRKLKAVKMDLESSSKLNALVIEQYYVGDKLRLRNLYTYSSGDELIQLSSNTSDGHYLYAEGSGALAAKAAMFAGATPLEAVQISALLVPGISAPFAEINLDEIGTKHASIY